MTIIDHPSPNHSARDPRQRVDTVLIHHTGPGKNHLGWLCDPKAGVSAHYLIDPDGKTWRLVDERRKAWHAGKGHMPWEPGPDYDFNHRSIGIELVNPGDGKTPFTEAQYVALAWLVPDIVRRRDWRQVAVCNGWKAESWERPKRLRQPAAPLNGGVGYILGHRDVAPGRKTDPADNFDWDRVRKALAASHKG